MLSSAYFVVAAKPHHSPKGLSDLERTKSQKLRKVSESVFLCYENGITTGEDYCVFEREDAARRQFEASKNHCQFYGGTLHLLFIRALSKSRAANASFNGGGETIGFFEVSQEQAKEYSLRIDAEKRQHDISLCQNIIGNARQRGHIIEELSLPESATGDLFKELWNLERKIEELVRDGKVPHKEYVDYQERSETRMIGFSKMAHIGAS